MKLKTIQIPDGQGSYKEELVDDIPFRGSLIASKPRAIIIGDKYTSTTEMVLWVRSDVELDFNDYVRQADTGDIYRIAKAFNNSLAPMDRHFDYKKTSVSFQIGKK